MFDKTSYHGHQGAVLLLFLVSFGAHAATLVVGPAQPYMAIQDALVDAQDGDVIEVEPGVYTGPLLVDVPNLQLVGIGGPLTTTLSSASVSATVEIAAANITLAGFDLFNSDGAAITSLDWNLTLDDIRVVGMFGTSPIDASGYLTVIDSTFSGNGSPSSGGAISMRDSSHLTVVDSVFTGNVVNRDGGAIDLGEGGQHAISGSQFTDNIAGIDGGAIHQSWRSIQGYGTLNVDLSTFERNTAIGSAGAISGRFGSISQSVSRQHRWRGRWGGHHPVPRRVLARVRLLLRLLSLRLRIGRGWKPLFG